MRNAILAAGLVVAGVSARLATVSPAPVDHQSERTNSQPSQATDSNLPDDHPVARIYDFFNQKWAGQQPLGTRSGQLSGSLQLRSSLDPSKTVGLAWEADVAAGQDVNPDALSPILGKINFVVATVPDPQGTHLALNFDRYVESIISAAVDSGFIFDRYWLPWRIEAQPDASDPDKRRKAENEKKKRETLPGLLLFRRPPDLEKSPRGALAIFLVGDTPTSGLNRQQFHNAVHFIGSLAPSTSVLSVLGPTYSGSLDSLDRALQEDLPAALSKVTRQIVSGTASDQRAWDQFQDKEFRVGGAYGTFSTTIHSDSYALDALRASGLMKNQRLAVVAEDATVYGGQFIRDKKQAPLIVYYPREISRVRNAYQDDPALSAESVKSAPGTRQQLILDLKDTQVARDTLPQFSAGQTPVTQETVLLHVTEFLKRERIQVALVTGTNPLDVLFLTRVLRTACPNVRLIVLEPDLLFVHGADTETYRGILAVTTYPLIPENQEWSGSPVRRFFASNSAEGMYNAGLLLLRPIAPRQPADPLREYATPVFEGGAPSAPRWQTPPLWLTAIGHYGYSPIALLPATHQGYRELTDSDYQQPAPAPLGSPSHLWTLVFAAMTLLGLALFASSVHARKSGPLPRWCADLHPAPDGESVYGRSVYLCVTMICALLAYYTLALAPIEMASTALASQSPSWRSWLAYSTGGAAVIALLFALLVSTTRWTPWRLVLVVAPILLGLWLYVTAVDGGTPTTVFRAMRSVQEFSGLAPDLPLFLLIAALGWWAWTQMQRFIFGQERIIYLPELRDLPPDMAAPLEHLLAQKFPYVDGLGWFLMAGAFASTFAAGTIAIRSLESRRYDVTLAFLVALVASALLGTGYYHLRIWRGLRQLLEDLELHPIRGAFSRLPGNTSWLSWWQPSARKRSYTLPTQSVQCLRLLSSVAPGEYPELDDNLTKLSDQWNQIQPVVQLGQRETAQAANNFNQIAARIASNLAEKLEREPWSKGSSDSWDKSETEHGKGAHKRGKIELHGGLRLTEEFPAEIDTAEKPGVLAAEFVALRYVAFIRYIVLHLRNLLSFLTVGFILLAIALNCYPFQGGSLFRWWITAIFVMLAVTVIDVFAGMERDAVLSRLTDTTAGKLDMGFYLKLVSAGVLPFLTVIASHFPSVGKFLVSWFQPAVSAMQ